jgi:hypothetical protein
MLRQLQQRQQSRQYTWVRLGSRALPDNIAPLSPAPSPPAAIPPAQKLIQPF